jgi:hypothetical protein
LRTQEILPRQKNDEADSSCGGFGLAVNGKTRREARSTEMTGGIRPYTMLLIAVLALAWGAYGQGGATGAITGAGQMTRECPNKQPNNRAHPTIEASVIEKLPLATQNFHQLLNLSTGALSELNASPELGRGDVGIEVDGRGTTTTLFVGWQQRDGHENSQLWNTPLPSPDAIGIRDLLRTGKSGAGWATGQSSAVHSERNCFRHVGPPGDPLR